MIGARCKRSNAFSRGLLITRIPIRKCVYYKDIVLSLLQVHLVLFVNKNTEFKILLNKFCDIKEELNRESREYNGIYESLQEDCPYLLVTKQRRSKAKASSFV